MTLEAIRQDGDELGISFGETGEMVHQSIVQSPSDLIYQMQQGSGSFEIEGGESNAPHAANPRCVIPSAPRPSFLHSSQEPVPCIYELREVVLARGGKFSSANL